MSEFREGDRVIVVRYTGLINEKAKKLILNQPGTVDKVVAGNYIIVNLDNDVVGLTEWCFHEDELEGLL